MGGIAAIILAAGAGQRMKSSTPKQFMQLAGRPVFLYSLKAFDEFADRIVLVTGGDWFDWCEEQIANIRTDTHADNAPMQHIVRKCGYQRCGIIRVANGTLRTAFQKDTRL